MIVQSPTPKSGYAELVEALSFSSCAPLNRSKKKQPFDKLGADGDEAGMPGTNRGLL